MPSSGKKSTKRLPNIFRQADFLSIAKANFTPYYRPLIPWVNRLRMKVFPNNKRWRRLDPTLIAMAKAKFTPYYQPLVPWLNRLRRKIFPNNARQEKGDPTLYSSMKEILCEAQKDPEVQAADNADEYHR